MRLPLTDDGAVDEEEAVRILRVGIDGGVNYVDTAIPIMAASARQSWERPAGRIPEKVWLADKCPVWDLLEEEEISRSF